jgi:hypothetical protein
MAPIRFRTSVLFAFFLLFLYLIFPSGRKDVPYENYESGRVSNGGATGGGVGVKPGPELDVKPPPLVAQTKEKPTSKATSTIELPPTKPTIVASSTSVVSSAVPKPTNVPLDDGLKQQDLFNEQFDALGQ